MTKTVKPKNPVVQEILGMLVFSTLFIALMVYGYLNPYEGTRVEGASLAFNTWVLLTISYIIYFVLAVKGLKKPKKVNRNSPSPKATLIISKVTLLAWLAANGVFFLTADYMTWFERHNEEIFGSLAGVAILVTVVLGAVFISMAFSRRKKKQHPPASEEQPS